MGDERAEQDERDERDARAGPPRVNAATRGADVNRDGRDTLSAQCPACSLHELVPIYLHRDARGRWRQLKDADALPEGTLELDACPVCFGVWFDQGELDTLGDAEVDPGLLKTLMGRSAHRMCPRGHGFMNEHALPGLLRTPVDRCPRCRGLWLDGDERRELAGSSTREGQEERSLKLAKRGFIWAAQLLTQLPVEVENPARGTPWVVYIFGGALLVLYQLSVFGIFYARDWALVGAEVRSDPRLLYTALTHVWFHADAAHLLVNLYFLYVFGDNVEHLFGRLRYSLLLLGAAMTGALLQILLASPGSPPVIGASGAIAGVLAAYLWLFPRARLLQTVPFIFVQVKIPVWVYVLIWIGCQVVMAAFSSEVDFAWYAHIGGFMFGAAMTPVVVRWRQRRVAAEVRVPSAAFFLGKPPEVVRRARAQDRRARERRAASGRPRA
ncbi:MAG: rhomboid family intramembrane serine protease [Myxococcales bacterium]|nr:rhomboid family intramembrane serine protease [Myxococcales bacterium]MCB9752582.1 rhomboid family intramembrane serine protease [Myxococcales bacterium]